MIREKLARLKLRNTPAPIILTENIPIIAIIQRVGGPAQIRTEIPIFGGVDSFQLSYRAAKLKAATGFEPASPELPTLAPEPLRPRRPKLRGMFRRPPQALKPRKFPLDHN